MSPATTTAHTPTHSSSISTTRAHRLNPSKLKLPFAFHKFTRSSHSFSSLAISCTLSPTRDPELRMDDNGSSTLLQRPDSFGRFGKFGGKYVPETLMHALTELESAFHSLASDHDFQVLCFWLWMCLVRWKVWEKKRMDFWVWKLKMKLS
jgi:tryptophan synthase beta chain